MAKSLLKSTSVVSSMTLLSRILGFVRDMMLAHLFGAGFALDAFFVAFKIPNFMRRLFAEGAFSQAFVPVLAEYTKQRSHYEVREFISHMLGTLGAVLLLVTIVAELATPLIIGVFAPGFVHDPDPTRFTLASDMLKITFPYLLCISLTAFAGAVMNTYNRFAIPAFTPVILNLAMIWAALYLAPQLAISVTALAWGVFIAGVVQFLFQLPFLWRLRLLPWPRVRFRDPGVIRVLKLMVPALFGVSVAQISILVDTVFASFLPVGSVSWLYYSDRLTNLPLGVFGVAIATVVLPHLSKRHAEKSTQDYQAALDWGVRMVLLIGIPSAFSLFILAGPILTTLFNYGEFSAHDVMMAQQSMWAFAFGVPMFMMVKVLAAAFYARQEIKVPVKVAVVALICNMVLNLALIVPLKHAGLALSTTIAAFVNVGLLCLFLKRRQIFRPQRGWRRFLLRMFLANGMLVSLLWLGCDPLDHWLEWGAQARIMHLSALVIAGITGYFFVLYLTGFGRADLRPQTKPP